MRKKKKKKKRERECVCVCEKGRETDRYRWELR